MEVRFCDDALPEFIDGLEVSTVAKVLRTIDLLEEFGHRLGMPHSKKVAGRLFELRVRGRQEVRIFYTFYQETAVLLHGFVKKSQKIPRGEINLAQQKLSKLDSI